MIKLDLTEAQMATIAKAHLDKMVKEYMDWFNGMRPEDIKFPNALDTIYAITLLRQAREYL